MTQLRPASERLSSFWILGSATIAMVPSMVAISCIPAMAMTAAKNRRVGSQVVEVVVGVDSAVLDWCAGGM